MTIGKPKVYAFAIPRQTPQLKTAAEWIKLNEKFEQDRMESIARGAEACLGPFIARTSKGEDLWGPAGVPYAFLTDNVNAKLAEMVVKTLKAYGYDASVQKHTQHQMDGGDTTYSVKVRDPRKRDRAPSDEGR